MNDLTDTTPFLPDWAQRLAEQATPDEMTRLHRALDSADTPAVCIHYAPVERHRGCDARGGMIAMRDCLGAGVVVCGSYEPDPVAGPESTTEPERLRWRLWVAGVRDRRGAG
jgi:hypothetical protein